MFIFVVAIDVPCLDNWLWILGGWGGGSGLGSGMFVVVVGVGSWDLCWLGGGIVLFG